MYKYFVVYYAEENNNIPMNDIIEYTNEISNIQDIRNIEKIIENKWFNDGRKIVLINYIKNNKSWITQLFSFI